ncbi:DEAD-box ATP-dependent RNA helicase CshA [Frigoriglobus tundricola]|uniref:DEAD-box ATP-dependent RNA helicase CshA n=1 Tax=Frigoriglobus tundricola TaxID=2774151 RepID=A0A6M5YH15_9BACT|nr:DEAD-box ATP-dependent RNA helicase CshA [Frigoriglobus tundricola]
MEPVLTPPTNGDDWTVPETGSKHVPSDEPVDELPPDSEAAADGEETDDPESEPGDPADDPDHESAPPPEVDPAMTFADLKLIRPLMDAITHAGYTHPTPIQEAVIPPALRGKDVIGQAQTGTGKTAAFLIPFLNRWRPHTLKGPIGLVMTPTRELALQIATEADRLAPSTRFRTVPVYGGTGMQRQLTGLARGCDLVAGTPGRVLDHLQRGSLSLSQVRYAVLDEADRMLDIGFRDDIERILKRCPTERQTLLMSATVPDAIKRLVNRYMRDPVHLNMTPDTPTVDKIRQSYFTVDADRKFELLKRVVEREKPRQCLIFVERKRWADNLYRDLKRAVPKAAVIHGDLPQTQREKIMAAFRTGDIKYLIATDVMSRGIDVSDLSHVINYDLPMDIENYVHRIGRTGRIGKDGIAISFVLPEQGELLTNIEMMINRLIEADRIEGFEAAAPRANRPPAEVKVVFSGLDSVKPPPKPDGEDDGWGDDAPPAAPAAGDGDQPKKPVFGRRNKRYSQRL